MSRVPNPNHATRDDNEEANLLLESVGGKVALMETYEEGVLRQAELDAAPKLTGIGFPSMCLESLLPSFHARTNKVTDTKGDIPHIRTVLSRTRSALQRENAQKKINLLRLKEHILLSCLSARVSSDDMPIQSSREIVAEQKRSDQLFNTSLSLSSSLSSPPQLTQTPQAAIAIEPLQEKGYNQTVSHSLVGASNRLEHIKASVSFAKQSPQKNQQPRLLRKRVSIMERKKARSEEVAQEEEEEEEETKEIKKLTRQRRKERQERKRQRRERWATEHTSCDSDNEAEFDEPETFHSNLENMNENIIVKQEPSDSACDINQFNTETSARTSKQEVCGFTFGTDCVNTNVKQEPLDSTAQPQSMSCPRCHQLVSFDGSLSADAALAEHINQCQLRRSTRQTPQLRGNLNDEIGNNHPIKLEQQPTHHVPSRRNKQTSKKRKRSTTRPKPKPALDDLEEWQYEDRVDEWIESGIAGMREMKERNENETLPGVEMYQGGLAIPAWINDRLFSYQRTSLKWMWELHLQEAGGIVGDEMGLGKTVQVCAFLGAMAASRKLNSVLIVCPATMLQHWLSELKKWSPGLRRILIHASGEADGISRSLTPNMLRKLDKWLRNARRDHVNEAIDRIDYDEQDESVFCGTGYVIVTTYETVRRTSDVIAAHKFSYAVLDEGQKIRNPDADVTLACKKLRTPHRLLLSGTPIQNDLRELWSLFDFIFPGRLGTLPAFETEFADPIKRGGYSNASPMQVQLAYRCALVLRDLINPYLLRRQKKNIQEVSRMPGKTEQVLFCRLSDRQRSIYEAYLGSDEVRNILRGSHQLLRSITVLRKICNHPDLVCGADQSAFESFVRNGYVKPLDIDSSDDDNDVEFSDVEESLIERAGKLEILAKILPLWRKQGHRVLIFCQWKKMLTIIQKFTQAQGWKFSRMDGNTSVASRQNMVDTFNNDESYFGMLMTTRTGGVGLNLTGANRIILYDPDWNPQTDAQARERAWRFGQEKAVTVYRLISAGTIEEKIYQRQIFKTALSNKVLQDPRQRRLFSQRDLRDLFTLKADTGSLAKGAKGVTETGQLSRGGGVMDVDETTDSVPSSDNKDTLETVLKSKGLAGVFDHDFVDDPSSQKNASVREMEEHAKKVAGDALKALKDSIDTYAISQPTWTGSSETEPRRFGGGKRITFSTGSRTNEKAPNQIFGSAESAGVTRVSVSNKTSSGDLLAHLRQRNNQVSASALPAGSSQMAETEGISQYAELMKKLRNFVLQGPTTDQILHEFPSVPNCDAAVFRRLLNSVAKIEDGRWRIKPAI